MNGIKDARRHWRVPANWPLLDQALWRTATGPCHPLDIPLYGQTLKPPSLRTVERAYGLFLSFLEYHGELDVEAAPETRLTVARMADYLRHLEALRYSRQTKIIAISGLRCALRIFAPHLDTDWIWHPNKTPLVSRLQGQRKTFDVPHSADLFRWGLSLIVKSRQMDHSTHQVATMRDGLIIALLAARPLRRRTLAGLKLEHHLLQRNGRWRLILEPDDMKNERAIEFDVPQSLDAQIDHYLAVVRPKLLRGAECDAVWIAAYGRPFALTAIDLMIRRRAIEEFGVPFGPHRFRHAMGTTAAIVDPTHPGAAAAVLGIGGGMIEKHYNRAENHVAAADYHDALAAERAKLEPLARRHFDANP